MRIIGHLQNKATASVFSDYLYVNGISNVIETDKDGYAIWIHSEDELEKARDLLNAFLRNPNDPQYAQHTRQAQELKQREEKEERAAEKRHFDSDRIFRTSRFGTGPVTWLLIVASVGVTLAVTFGYQAQVYIILGFSTRMSGAPE